MTNSQTPRMAAIVAIFLAVIVTCSCATADDQATYESLSDVSIGRVFFSPKQREYLDRRRQGRPVRGTRRTTRPSDDSAGFIVNSAGESRIYSNGDFVAAAVTKTMDFPGDVSVVRQAESSPKPAKDKEHDAEPSDADD